MNYSTWQDGGDDEMIVAERALAEGIHANATRLYDFALTISHSSNVADDARAAAWALVAACNTFQQPVAADESLPL